MSVKGTSTKASILTWGQVEHLYNVAYVNKMYDLCKYILAASNYGLHVSEVLELTWDDVLSDTFFVNTRNGLKTVKNTEYAKERFMQLFSIDKYGSKNNYIILNRYGGRFSIQRLNVKFKDLNRISKLNVKNLSTESFRKAFAVHVYDMLPHNLKGSGLNMLSRYLGQSSITTTLDYMGRGDEVFEFSNPYEMFSLLEKGGSVKPDEEFVKEYTKPSYVYLMKDGNLPLYIKIGKANDVGSRERTLQGEKPTIVLYKYLRFDCEKEAFTFEKKLHRKYREQQARGEWYILSEEKLNELLSEYEWVDVEPEKYM